ncbi:response regulator transcription factor [Candidatus Gracilibacteria bacterium]|nr:response regulator transcription factor [Candidatus Gracilibacteria bacterium]
MSVDGDGPMVMVSQLTARGAQLRIVIFATSVDYGAGLLNVGAIGYVAKDDPVEYLITAIRAAKAGQRAVSPIVQRYLDQNTGRRKRFRITPREEVVLKLLAQGLRTPEVAEHMSIDLGTTQNHVTAMLRKTGCKDRMQLVIWYLRVYLEADSPANDQDDPNDMDDLDDPDDPDDPENPKPMGIHIGFGATTHAMVRLPALLCVGAVSQPEVSAMDPLSRYTDPSAATQAPAENTPQAESAEGHDTVAPNPLRNRLQPIIPRLSALAVTFLTVSHDVQTAVGGTRDHGVAGRCGCQQ